MPNDQPNLLFIWTDQQAVETLGAYGNEHIETPNLDALAAESTLFENAYVTQPVCGPSRSSIMTGLYPHATGMTENNTPLPESIPVFPELGAFEEYTTGFIGKWHLGDEIFAQRGFEEWHAVEDQYREFYGSDRDKQAHSDYYHFLVDNGFEPDVKDPDGFEWFSRAHAASLPEEYSKPAYMAWEATQFLKEVDEPFILHVMFLEPHSPYIGPRDDQYDPAEVPLPENFAHDGFDDQPLRIRLVRDAIRKGVYNVPWDVFGENPTEEDWRRMISNYWGLVSLVDTYVGEILDTLAAEGHAEETVTLFTSDHGDMMGSHQLVSKMMMFEEAVRVPLLVRVPGAERTGERVEQPVSQIDLVPTLLDAMGQDVPDHLHGESWLPFLDGANDLPNEYVFVEWNGPNVAGVRGRVPRDMSPGGERSSSARPYVKSEFLDTWTDDLDEDEILAEMLDPIRMIVTPDGWKLNYHQFGEHELYDLNADPDETRNLADEPAHAERVEDLADEIFRWEREYRDPVYLY